MCDPDDEKWQKKNIITQIITVIKFVQLAKWLRNIFLQLTHSTHTLPENQTVFCDYTKKLYPVSKDSAESIIKIIWMIYYIIKRIKQKHVYPKSDFGVPGISRKMDLRQVEQGFSSFFAKFMASFYYFSTFRNAFGTFQFKKSSNMPKKFQKNWRKALFNLP